MFVFYGNKYFYFFFFFSSRRRHTRFSRDWSSDVCSSDLDVIQSVGIHVARVPSARTAAHFVRVVCSAAKPRCRRNVLNGGRRLTLPCQSALQLLLRHPRAALDPAPLRLVVELLLRAALRPVRAGAQAATAAGGNVARGRTRCGSRLA